MLHRSFGSLRPGFLGLVGPFRPARIAAAAAALAGAALLGFIPPVLARGPGVAAGLAIPFGPSLAAAGWQAVSFPGRPAARFTARGSDAVHIETAGGAGLLWRPLPASAAGATAATWRWRKALGVGPTDLSRKGGDDRLLAVYFAFVDPRDVSGRTDLKALLRSGRGDILMYVWGGQGRPGTVVNVPYFKGRGRAVVKQPADAAAETWFEEHAALVDDFRRAFGRPPGRLVAIALSSDADDTGGHNIAALADLYVK